MRARAWRLSKQRLHHAAHEHERMLAEPRGQPGVGRAPVADDVHAGRGLGVEVDDLHAPDAQGRHHLLLDMRLLDRSVVQGRRPDVEGAAARGELDLSQRGARPGRGLDVHVPSLRFGTARRVT